MAQFKRVSRQEAVDFLNSSENWRSLRRNNHRIAAPDDMATSTLRRYANALRRVEATGGWVHDLSEIRGHTASEHHEGRGRRKGFENWRPPERIPRMWNEPIFFAAVDRHGRRVRKEARLTVTRGETVAVRALNQAIREGRTVAMTLTGPLPGQKISLFWRGGYNPKELLGGAHGAGYHVTRTGRYVKVSGASLERWLINYIAQIEEDTYRGTGEKWPFIALYQIYAAEQITEVDLVPQDHQRTYYLPLKRGINQPVEVAPTARPSWTKQHTR